MSRYVGKKAFCALCGGISLDQLRKAVHRDKVSLKGLKTIDIDDPKNKEYMLRIQGIRGVSIDPDEYLSNSSTENSKQEKEKPKTNNISKEEQEKIKDQIRRDEEARAHQKKLQDLEVAKKEEELRLRRIQREKMEGQLIPVEVFKTFFNEHFSSVTTAFHQGAIQITEEIAAEFEVPKSKLSKSRKALIRIVNKSIEDSILISTDFIEKVQKDFNETK